MSMHGSGIYLMIRRIYVQWLKTYSPKKSVFSQNININCFASVELLFPFITSTFLIFETSENDET